MNNIITKLEDFRKFNTLPLHIDLISPTKTIGLHFHDCVEMIFVKNGNALNYVDSFPFNNGRKNLFLISGPVSHTMLDFKDFTAYRILFDMSIFNEFDEAPQNSPSFISLFAMSNMGVINNTYHSIMSMSEEYTNRLIPIFDELLCAYEEGGILAESYIKSLFYAAVSLILKNFNEKSKTKTYYNPALYHAFWDNFDEHTSISELADNFNISRVYLYKLFIKTFGKSPKQLASDMRLRNAKTLLTLTDKSITEVASACGFENPVYFAAMFKSREGVSPTQYRKNTKKGDV